MTIWVDADACPIAARDILVKAANRTQHPCFFVANHFIKLPPSPYLKHIQVEPGFDVADDHIAQQANSGDLVVTSDIPLAAEVIEKGGHVITTRGDIYDKQNIRHKLNMRDFMDTLRASGEHHGGQQAYGSKEKQQFANALDRYLAKRPHR